MTNALPSELLNKAADDPIVIARTRALVFSILDEVEDMLHDGTPNMKLTIVKTILPTLARGLEKESKGDGLDELREEMRAMFAEMKADREPAPAT